MKTGREGVIADDTTLDAAGAYPEAGSTVVPEGESDDEYEQIPARKEKSRRTDSPTRAVHVAHPPPPRDDKAPDPGPADDTREAAEAAEQVKGGDEAPATEATDDDWLRSRTNRLLDLVDPDDLPAQQAPGPEERPPQQETENSSEEVTHDEVEDATTGEEMTTGDAAVDAISKTSRLFVRNLPFSVTEEDIRDAFEEFGSLQEVRDDCLSFFSSPGVRRDPRRYDEPQIGTAYTSVYDETLGENFSRCFDFLSQRLANAA